MHFSGKKMGEHWAALMNHVVYATTIVLVLVPYEW